MSQAPSLTVSQLNSVVSLECHRLQNELRLNSMSSLTSSPAKATRKRGVILTQQGWQKLQQAGVLHDDFGKRYTHEELSERSLLDARTVSRVLSCEVKVDKGTLKTFFQAFHLPLETGDYIKVGDLRAENNLSVKSSSIATIPDDALLLHELVQLKQDILNDLNHLFNLLEKIDRLSNKVGSVAKQNTQITRQLN